MNTGTRTAFVGQPVSRVDGHLKVTGAAKYAAEHDYPNLAHAALVFSTIPKGEIASIDANAAAQATGVVAVITHDNAPKMRKTEAFDAGSRQPKAAAISLPLLNTTEIHWDGQPVAIVVAETQDQADAAAALVKVQYKTEIPALSLEAEKPRAFVPPNLVGEEPEVKRGDAETALLSAKVTVGNIYTTPPHNHNPIEPHAAVAVWDGDDKLTVHDASQYIMGGCEMLAEKFGIPQTNVRVLSPFVGGGFGSKGNSWPHVALCAAAAKFVGRPVKLALTREGMYRTVGGRSQTEQHVSLGATRDGKLISIVHNGYSITSTDIFAEPFTFPARHLYASPNLFLSQKVARVDRVRNTFMRAPGENPGNFALESAMDELAFALDLDPIELRLRNEPEKDPARETPFSLRNLPAAFRVGAEKFGWARRSKTPRMMRDGKWLIGMGVATAFYPVYQFPAAAKVEIYRDGTAVVKSATHEMGMGTATAQRQIAADALGLPLEKVRFELGDTDFPMAAVSGGSSTTVSVGSAVQAACEAAKRKLYALASDDFDSPFADVRFDQLETRDGGLYKKDSEETGETYRSILNRYELPLVEAEGNTQPGMEQMQFFMGSWGAQFAEVGVHEETGETRVRRFLGVFDCGKILNPKTARSQFIGGITMGIGMALEEETLFDTRIGRIMNPSLAEYHVPVNADVPVIEAHFLDIPDPHTPLGAHGVGEIGITGVAAAIANAVFNATGRRVRDLPITLDKLL